ncbi:hypothetical protein BZG36_02895 [Bifiguratus adelaidae]|uniref:TRUD domain-containing protein n=1 Tax=Bifiguratus adelaidae TaxID=1938954 RepID=A0A261Y225_9FUNG|nr:hypothetical protein BZG36_02895 [Bifiguratus adelaidae]
MSLESETAMPVNEVQGVDYVREADVGIRAFASPNLSGFSGIIKQRYLDFLVNEIDSSGNAVHLTDLEPSSAPSNAAQTEEEAQNPPITNKQIMDELAGLVGAAKAEEIKAMLDEEAKERIVETEEETDKAKRTAIHQFIKEHLGKTLTTETRGNNIIKIRFKTAADQRDRRNQRAKYGEFDQLGGNCLEFVLYKENKDTMEVVNNLARTLRCQPKVFGYAGTKDKRGVTVQKITAFKIHAERIAGLNRTMSGCRFGNFRYVRDPLRLGNLKGNRFTIVLRNVHGANEEDIVKSLSCLKENGFINYYGMQRFGTASTPTNEIGRLMLQEKWADTVDLILRPRSGENEMFTRARKLWADTKDAEATIKLFPKRAVAECQILHAFAKRGSTKDALGAINAIPRNLRLMYVHAYQSYVWNCAASERIAKYGQEKPVIGDLVFEKNADTPDMADVELDDVDVDRKMPKVLVLDTNTIDNYTIYDVVLPQPGHKVIYPTNEIGIFYEDLMAKDGLNPHEMVRKVKEYSLTGAYRKLMAKPNDLTWKLMRYSDAEVPLTLTDLEKLEGKVQMEHANGFPDSQDGEHLAVVLELSLQTSQYATMALREVMRQETSSAFQSLQNPTKRPLEESSSANSDADEPIVQKARLDEPV